MHYGIIRLVLSDELGGWMEARAWELPAEALERLETLVGLWLRYGVVMNLTGARTRAELMPHILDGLDTAWIVRQTVGQDEALRWVDFGSGGGFPGLVVGSVLEAELQLLEPRQKRASFLELATNSIGRGSIEGTRARYDAATWGQEAASGFLRATEAHVSVVSARAVWPPDAWLKVARHVTNGHGHVVMHLSSGNSPASFGCVRAVESERGTVGLVTLTGEA